MRYLGCAVIRIRYRSSNEFSPGLHAAAERHGRNTTVYLLPGLSAAQRRAALRRLRIAARMGRGPRLPPARLGLALLADRIRTWLGQAGAIVRSHPAGSTVPVMVISAGAVAFLALSAVSIRVVHAPQAPRPSLAEGLPAATAEAVPIPGHPGDPAGADGSIPGGAGAASEFVTPARTGRGPAVILAGQPVATAAPDVTGGGTSGGGSGGSTILTGRTGPTPAPTADGTSTAIPIPVTSAPAPEPSPVGSGGTGHSGACLHLGPIGVCL